MRQNTAAAIIASLGTALGLGGCGGKEHQGKPESAIPIQTNLPFPDRPGFGTASEADNQRAAEYLGETDLRNAELPPGLLLGRNDLAGVVNEAAKDNKNPRLGGDKNQQPVKPEALTEALEKIQKKVEGEGTGKTGDRREVNQSKDSTAKLKALFERQLEEAKKKQQEKR